MLSYDKAWAKREGDHWHSLVAHSADVAAVLRALLTETRLGDRLSTLAGMDLSRRHIARLSALAFLHDAGKANWQFQRGDGGHLSAIIGLLETPRGAEYLSSLPLTEMASWVQGQGHLRRYLKTTWSHHGVPIPSAQPQTHLWQEKGGYDPRAELDRLASRLEDWFGTAFEPAPPFPDSAELENAYAGALTLADWIGSDRRYFPFENGDDEGAWDRARSRAASALEKMGLGHAPPTGMLEDVLDPHEPYDVQEAGTDIEGHLTVAESPTGSGKTELALGRFARLYQEGEVDGLYFAVPTRAAAKQLHGRVEEAAEALFDDPPPVVQAVPGYVKADDQDGIRRGFDVFWESETDRKRNWAAERSKRYLASAIAVGTIDQVLLAMLESAHAHLRAAGLLRSLLVVDEVHASSVYMNSILKRVLGQHLGAGGHALLMSATLGSEARSDFLGTEAPSLESAESEDYPYVATRSGSRSASLPGEPKHIEIEVRRASDLVSETTEAIGPHAAKARVLAICNTVGRARSVQDSLSCRTLSVRGREVAHHSRYAQPDRDLLDDAVEEVYGEGAPPARLATVATQTVEQSLDIDSDLLVSDLCPMDVLLQRIGRLHRHDRGDLRPDGYETPRCIVIAPREDLESYLTPEGEAWGPMGLGTVYEDLRVLKATLEELESRGRITIPGDNRPLVEQTTHSDVRASVEQLSDRWAAHGKDLRRKVASEEANSGLVAVDWSVPYSQMSFTEADVMTRLGDADVTVELDAETPLGNEVSELSLPAWMFESPPEDPEATLLRADADGFSFEVSGQTFRYEDDGFSRDGS